jgi:hypothetical protein
MVAHLLQPIIQAKIVYHNIPGKHENMVVYAQLNNDTKRIGTGVSCVEYISTHLMYMLKKLPQNGAVI